MSCRLSPFETLEPFAAKLMTSALRRLAAASNEMRVRVESSKKRLTTVLPRSVGSFLTSRDWVSAMSSAMSRMPSASVARERLGVEQVPHDSIVTSARSTRSSPSVSRSRTFTRSSRALGRFLPTKSGRIGSSRWPRSTRVGEPHGGGPADVLQRIEGGADAAAGEEHVVHEHHHLAVDPAGRDLGALRRTRGVAVQVVAVHRDVERAARAPARPPNCSIEGGDARARG